MSKIPHKPRNARRCQSKGRRKEPVAVQPKPDANPEAEAPTSVLRLIQRLQSGDVDAASLSNESRRACVEHLTAEGYSVPEIAQILKTSDRTVARTRAQIRESHAAEASPELTKQTVGGLLREAETVINRLRRATRGSDVSVSDKIEAEKSAWNVQRDLVQLLQRLGYLPSAPYLVQGQVLHRSIDESGLHLREEVDRLEQIIAGDPTLAENQSMLRFTKKVKSSVRELAANSIQQDSKKGKDAECRSAA